MGLTIHYDLIAPPETDATRARELVRQMRRRAQAFKHRGRVGDVLPIGSDTKTLDRALEYKDVPHPWKPGRKSGIDIPAEEGFLFSVEVGEDCEPAPFALCRYPKTVVMGGRRYRTDLPGWRFHGFSKTQYASLHGWEHFRRCHTVVIDLVGGMRRLGLEVRINDEGDYWPGRSLPALRQNLDEMNGMVAAAAGAMKDMYEATNGTSAVQSPVFAHRDFERLEAEGEARAGGVIRQAGGEISRLLRKGGGAPGIDRP